MMLKPEVDFLVVGHGINMNVEIQDVVSVCSECCCWFYGEFVVLGAVQVA